MASAAAKSGRLNWQLFGLLVGVLCIFALVLAVITWGLRDDLRQQLLERDAAVLEALSGLLWEQQKEVYALAELPLQDMLFATALQASRMAGVLAVEAFTPDGTSVGGAPLSLQHLPELSAAEWEELAAGEALGRYFPDQRLDHFLQFSEAVVLPQVLFWVPVQDEFTAETVGFVVFLVDARPLAQAYEELDAGLWLQSGSAYLAGSLVIIGLLAWSLGRLQRALDTLSEREQRLRKAYQELQLRTRTSALGGMAAHLLHGLRNAFLNLNLLLDKETHTSARDAAELDVALARMKQLMDEGSEMIRDQSAGLDFEYALDELCDTLRQRFEKIAPHDSLRWESAPSVALSSQRANLVHMILSNLIQNALEASRGRGEVRIRFVRENERVCIDVCDQGPGLPPELAQNPFTIHSASTKATGSGMGLAISQQLAREAQGQLRLHENGPSGACFRLELELGVEA